MSCDMLLVDSLLGRDGVERVSYDMLRLLTVYSVEAGWMECHTTRYVCCQFTRSRRGEASVIRHVTFVDSLLGRGGMERVSYDMLRWLTVDSVEAGWMECHTTRYVCCQFTRSRRGGASVMRHVRFVDSLLGRGGVERVSYGMLRLLTVYSVETGWSECHTACYVC